MTDEQFDRLWGKFEGALRDTRDELRGELHEARDEQRDEMRKLREEMLGELRSIDVRLAAVETGLKGFDAKKADKGEVYGIVFLVNSGFIAITALVATALRTSVV